MSRKQTFWTVAFLATSLFVLAVGSQFVSITYGAAPDPPALDTARLSEADRARVRNVDGIPFLRFSGTPYEMGRQHGTILRDQILFLEREYMEPMIVRLVGKPVLKKWAKSVEAFIPKHYREEIRGIADGAGIPYERVLLINTMVDRFQSMMCSTVVAGPDLTADGQVYFGRNLDFPSRGVLHKCTVVVVYEPKGGRKLAAVTWPGLIGVLSGMNSDGVAGATMMIHWGKDLEPGMPYMIMYREALANAKTPDDVVATIRKTKRTCPNNFMVADESGKAVVVEWDQTNVGTRRGDKGGLCSTNYFRTDELKGTGVPLGLGRYRTLEKFLAAERGKIERTRIQKALVDVANPWWTNVQSMIFVPKRRELWLSSRRKLPVSRGPFVAFDQKTLFGKPAASRPNGAAATPDTGSK